MVSGWYRSRDLRVLPREVARSAVFQCHLLWRIGTMKTRIVLVCIAIMAIMGSARADQQLMKLLGNKETEYAGVCRVNTQGNIVFTEQETVGVVECIVGVEPKDKDVKYILIWNGVALSRLVKFTKKTATTPEKQEVIWRNPDTML
jgi:hypothetical protein